MKEMPSEKRRENNELLQCMEYLHGDVVDNEFAAACCYEYERELHYLLNADDEVALKKEWAQRLEEGGFKFVPLKESDKYVFTFPLGIEDIFRCGLSFTEYARNLIRRCPSFPQKSWNQLNTNERSDILKGFVRKQIQPLEMQDVRVLQVAGILDKLKTLAARATGNKRRVNSKQKVYPIIEEPSCVHALFTLDRTKTRKQLLKEFNKWCLDNKALFNAQKQNRARRMGLFKDRLKDLAAWRLYDALGYQQALDFAEKNRKPDKNGKAKKFHDARQGQTTKVPKLNGKPDYSKAPLYSEESGFLKAKGRALNFLDNIDVLAECQYGVPRTTVEI